MDDFNRDICFDADNAYVSNAILGGETTTCICNPCVLYICNHCLIRYFLYEKPKFSWVEVSHLSILIPIVIAGVTIGLTDYFAVKSINLGGDISTIMPILLGGSAILVALLSFVLFKESISVTKAIGIVLAIVGIFFIHKG